MLDDQQLLRRYTADGSEAAFGELVARYVNLVYSVALRRTGGAAHLAEDVVQLVFTDLARKARSLPPSVVLAGWLHRATRYAAGQLRRTERRRQAREQEAVAMNTLESEPAPDWEQIRPLLDGALDRLGRADRDAVLLRFFEQRSLADVGRALGSNEDATRKRVSRALDKLRAHLVHRGATTTAAALAAAISSNAVQVAPAGLAATLTAAAVKGTAVTTSTLTLIKGALKIMAWTKLKTAVVVGVGTILVGGTVTITTTIAIKALAPHGYRTFAPEQLGGAEQTARDFFEAIGKGDWNAVAKLCPPAMSVNDDFTDAIKSQLTGLEIMSLGKAFTKPPYPGVFVPYEIRFKTGEVKKFRLAVRRDNLEGRWYFDGGL